MAEYNDSTNFTWATYFFSIKKNNGVQELHLQNTDLMQKTSYAAASRGLLPISYFKGNQVTKLELWGTSSLVRLNTYHLYDTLNGTDLNLKCLPN
jgi:hypothetical protein